MLTDKEKKEFKRELWKIMHDENGSLLPSISSSPVSFEEFTSRNFPPKIAEEMIKEYNESSFERNYSKNLSEIDEIGYEDLKHIRYEDI